MGDESLTTTTNGHSNHTTNIDHSAANFKLVSESNDHFSPSPSKKQSRKHDPPVGDLIDLTSDEDEDSEDRTPLAGRSPITTPVSSCLCQSVDIFRPAYHIDRSGSDAFNIARSVDMIYLLCDAPRCETKLSSQSSIISAASYNTYKKKGVRDWAKRTQHDNEHYRSGTAGSRRSSFSSDIENMSTSDAELHSELNEISTQVLTINQKLSQMEEQRLMEDDKHGRVKQENAVLQERLHALEEHVQAVEDRWREKHNDEKQRNRDLLQRLEREKTLELEAAALRYQVLEKQVQSDSAEKNKLTARNTQLEETLRTQTDRLEELQFEFANVTRDKQEIEHMYKQLRDETSADIATSSDMVDELNRQNNELRASMRTKPRQSSLVDRTIDLEDELNRLRDDYKQLQEANEELHAQLLQASVETGKQLLNAGRPSLAAELHGKDKDENDNPAQDYRSTETLINALKEQEICNQKLRAYVEGILIRVIERHPEILEISANTQPE